MEEIILNYIDMSEEQKINALKNLKNIGFYPAYGTELTMKKIMDKSVVNKMPQFFLFLERNS